ncbi:hypothetical protein DRJ19_04035 [Candidatus Woesearchaeota archaeon]|nr:MAG: hypothetical protein DRJ19_04035 [Candidatus Woesearchaeota archaeon]RLE43917.1 MAG: hypothetical protein DRJ16_03175 [Candidatus Woesearchaeota archaeon]
MNKKGISALLATLLLLGVAVGLGVLVMNWGRAIIEGNAQCSVKSGLKIIELNGKPQICYSKGVNGFIRVMVENGPNIDIEGLIFRVIGTKNVYTTEVPTKIKRGHALMPIVPYDHDQFGDIIEVKITPRIKVYGDETAICPEQAIVVTSLEEC